MSHWTKDDEIQSGMMNSVWQREQDLQKKVDALEQRVHALEQMLKPIKISKVLGEPDAN